LPGPLLECSEPNLLAVEHQSGVAGSVAICHYESATEDSGDRMLAHASVR
jgi:hypothetical protein